MRNTFYVILKSLKLFFYIIKIYAQCFRMCDYNDYKLMVSRIKCAVRLDTKAGGNASTIISAAGVGVAAGVDITEIVADVVIRGTKPPIDIGR